MCHPDIPDDGRPPVTGISRTSAEVPLADGSTIPSLVASPEDTTPSGGVLVIHDVYGVSPFYEDLTARLAAEGYMAILPDLFFREGPLAEGTREQARERRSRFDEVRALDDLEAVTGHLEGRLDDSRSFASIGFCMGGTFALDLATRRRDLKTVCYYGFPATNDTPRLRPAPAPLDIIDELPGPILGFWGEEDAGVGIDNVTAFEAGLAERSIDHEFRVYPGVGHGFMSASKFDPAHEAYEAATDSWERTLSFLREHVG